MAGASNYSRTRKLSLLEPTVLSGQLRGRVGSRRDYSDEGPRELISRGPLRCRTGSNLAINLTAE